MSDVTGTIAQVLMEDTPCGRCGYNLRGLAPTGLCPECGTPIAHSISGILLKHADPKWLGRLRFGISLKIWSLVLGIVGVVVVAVAVGSDARTMIVGIAGSALVLWATFLIASQEPRIALHEDPITLRKALRACAAAAFVGGVYSIGAINESWSVVWEVDLMVLSLIGILACGELLYFRRLAHRIPDLKLAKSTTLLMWGGPITVGLIIVLGLLAASGVLYKGRGEMAGLAEFAMGLFVVACGGFLLLVWYFRLLAKYRKAFRRAASKSRASVILQPKT